MSADSAANSADSSPFLRQFGDVNRGLVRLFNLRARELGLSRTHWELVSSLYRHGGITQTDLAQHLSMGRSPLGKAIDRLENSGLVERRPDPEDRRVNRLYLTPAADAIVKPAVAIRADIEATLVNSLGSRDLEALRNHLDTIRDVLDDALAREGGAAG